MMTAWSPLLTRKAAFWELGMDDGVEAKVEVRGGRHGYTFIIFYLLYY